jgi:hypothetical protein
MHQFLYGFIAGFVAASVVIFLYHAKVIMDYQKAVSTAGLVLKKIEGKITAIRKGL